jgi:glycosyltransferase involved in cell wall biosynthesis
MGRDLISRAYGRFYYLSYYLSESGHDVELILFSYLKNENEDHYIGNLKLSSVSLFPNPFLTLIKVYKKVKDSNPDWVFGFSDTYYGILAEYIARKIGKKSLVDAYDNYESYLSFAKPLHWLWRAAVRRSTLVTCAGPQLEELFKVYRREKPIHILPMTVSDSEFKQKDRQKCRETLRLPLDKKLIGFHGSISNSRGIKTLFEAVNKVQLTNPNVKLVLSGRLDRNIKIPKSVLYLGYIADNDIVQYINSMNMLAVINKNSRFGNYSYPVKLYEAMACKIPVVVSKTESTKWMMSMYPDLIVEPEDHSALANKINEIIDMNRIDYDELPTWYKITSKLSQQIVAINPSV